MTSPRLENWVSPNQDLLPDFIIGGAMKCGTTTLHKMLDMHPDVYIPSKEIRFFDLDNQLQHPKYNSFDKTSKIWTTRNMKIEKGSMWSWYSSLYEGKKNMVKGEDSTSYLASKIAAERIALQKKDIKLIFLLRQPSKRTYSNYNHMLQKGQAKWSFEDTLVNNPYSVLSRSLYKEQLEYYYNHIPKKRIKVIIFEDFISDTKSAIKDISIFLDIDFSKFPKSTFGIHANKAKLPLYPQLHTLKSRHIGNINQKYINSLQPAKAKTLNLLNKSLEKSYNKLNPRVEKKAPRLNDSTKEFLDEYFHKELHGIDELVGQEILSKWFN